MAEIATIARPYAEALFKASSGSAAATQEWLDALSAIAGAPQFLQFAESPKATPQQVRGLAAGVLGGSLPAEGQRFLDALIDNGRLGALPEIARQYRALANARSGVSDAVVYSAFPMDDAAVAGVAATLEKRFGRKLSVSVEVDPALIGGIRAVVGDEVLDTSLKARLEQMKVALTA
ncbi:MAG: F0F1 ATP synthase subunit delta [Xenophilus sp.]